MDPEKTQKLKRIPRPKKSVPRICAWCNILLDIMQFEIKEEDKIIPSHGICVKCYDKCKRELEEEAKSKLPE